MRNIRSRQTKLHMIWIFLFVLGFCCVFTGMALAQVDQGAINGVVKDTTGAFVPGALLTLTNTDTNFVLQGKSGASGEYSFSPIKIGHYTLSATAPKFETTAQKNITVNIQDRLSITLTLKPGTVQETVTVTAAPPLLQSESATVGQVMDTDTINNTALNGRNWIYIAQLTAGVNPTSGGNNTARGGGTGDFSANGIRTEQNNFIMDGVDNNVNVDDLMNGASYNVRPPPDALAEFKIDTADYSAEFGHSAGAVLNASIKSGTNHIHGDLWEYVRNTDFDAVNWNALATPPYHENQFGATLGLPIWKNKVFYFADAEDNRIGYAGPMTFTVPTQSMRNGDFSELFNTALTGKTVPIGIFAPNTAGQLPLTATGGAFTNPGGASVTALNGEPTTNVLNPGEPPLAGGTISGPTTGEMDTVATEVLAAYPHPNAGGWTTANYSTPGSGKTYNNLVVNMATKDDTWQWDQRLDFNISAKDQTYARFSFTHDQVANTPPLGPILDGGNDTGNYVGTNDFNLARNFMASETHLFTPKLINEFRLGYNWGKYEFIQSDSTVLASTLVPGMGGVPNTGTTEPNGGIPTIAISGSNSLSAAGQRRDVPCVERQNIYQILDNVTNIWRNHSFKFGMQLESIRTSISQPRYPRGEYNFSGKYSQLYGVGDTGTGMADMFTDNMAGASLAPDWNASYYRWYRAAYAQDDWKVNSKLTVNLGVRYDYTEPVSNSAGHLVNFVLLSQGLNPSTGAGTGTANWVMSSLVESQNLLPPNFTAVLTAENINVVYMKSKSLVNAQKDNFGPRIGFAYRIGSKTVVRSAYGMFFGAIEVPGASETTINYPFAYTSSFSNNYLTTGACNPSVHAGATNPDSECPSNGTTNLVNTPPLPYTTSLETGFSGYLTHGGISAFAGSPEVCNADPNGKTPYAQSYNLTVERQLRRAWLELLHMLEIAVGTRIRSTLSAVTLR